jgi:aarF domain-containing kinase
MLAARGLSLRSGARFVSSNNDVIRPALWPRALAVVTLSSGIWLAVDTERRVRVRAHFEAAVRAARLLRTCVVIARDYKAARSWTAGYVDDDVRAVAEEHNQWQQLAGEAEIFRVRAQAEGGAVLVEARARARQARERAMELGEKLATLRLQHAVASGLDARWDELHERNAERLHAMCAANGGLYVKLGQHVAQLDYIVPKAYTRALSRLFQHTVPSSSEDVIRIIEEDTGHPLQESFEQFETQPIASASLAQVHVAYERGTGRKLAVKVQHARLREACASDIAAVRLAVDAAGWLFPGDFRLRWVVDELAPHLPLELDFANEAQNLRRCAEFLRESHDLKSRVTLPEILPHLSSHRVLTMTFEDGCSVTDTVALRRMSLSPSSVSNLLSETFCSLIFDGGFCHCDPHPGNVLVRPRAEDPSSPQLVLLDHGLYRCGGPTRCVERLKHARRELPARFVRMYAELWAAIVLGDADGIRQVACSSVTESYHVKQAKQFLHRCSPGQPHPRSG